MAFFGIASAVTWVFQSFSTWEFMRDIAISMMSQLVEKGKSSV
ncbi:MAG: hypothetical protein R2827_04795 [Bdellovibrionales bacterium]